jgi:hypothetical protein
MTKKEVLDLKPAPRLEQIRDKCSNQVDDRKHRIGWWSDSPSQRDPTRSNFRERQAKKSAIATMPTSREYRHRAEECLKLANEAAEIYARMALLELAGDFRAMAQQLDLRARRATRRANPKQRFSSWSGI